MRTPLGWYAAFVGASALLYACPRPVGELDAGPPPTDAVPSSYDPVTGNAYEGEIDFDDARVRALDGTLLRAGATPCREPFHGRVYRVTDGDTIWVRGESVVFDAPVRMIGINTPEVGVDGYPSECFGSEATFFTEQLLDRVVYLSFDNECYDPYNRVLAYVHIGGGDGDLWERQVIRRGFGIAYPVGLNRTYEILLENDEQTARRENVGQWGTCR